MCDFDAATIHADTIAVPGLPVLRDEARLIPNTHGRFWRIQSADGAVSHLFGTAHSTNREVLALPEVVADAITSARVVSPEIDFTLPTRRHVENRVSRTQIWADLRRNYIFDNEPLPPEIIGMVRSRMAGIGWGREAPDALTLGAVAEVLLGDPCDDFLGGVVPIQDSLIHTIAHIAGVTVKGLEPADTFLTTMNRKDRRDTALAIIAVYGAYLKPTQDSRGRATLTALYLRGELGLASLIDRAFLMQELGEDDGARYQDIVDDYLIDERNRTFLAAAMDDLQAGGLLMAIGSAHLPGANGMVAMLQEAGFTVTRIPLPGEVE